MVKEQLKPSIFIHAVDQELHDNILRLDQKLKGFLTEINVKIEAIDDDELQYKEERKNQLSLLAEDVSKALDGIKSLVNMVLEEGVSHSQFMEMNREDLDALLEAFKQSLEKVSKIRDEF